MFFFFLVFTSCVIMYVCKEMCFSVTPWKIKSLLSSIAMASAQNI